LFFQICAYRHLTYLGVFTEVVVLHRDEVTQLPTDLVYTTNGKGYRVKMVRLLSVWATQCCSSCPPSSSGSLSGRFYTHTA
jgi:hypothetical protein